MLYSNEVSKQRGKSHIPCQSEELQRLFLASTKPKNNAGISDQTAVPANPEKTLSAGIPMASSDAIKNAPLTENGNPPGLKIHNPMVINNNIKT